MTAPLTVRTKHDDLDAVLARVDGISSRLLVLDFDGTLSDLVPHPDDAVLIDGAAEVLRQLARQTRLVISSGRGLEDLLARLPAPLHEDDIVFVGGHGTEVQLPGGGRTTLMDIPSAQRVLRLAADQLETALADEEGWQIELKPASVAIHHRRADDDSVRRRLPDVLTILKGLQDEPPGWDVLNGNAVTELRPSGHDKGRALRWLVERNPGLVPLVIGDDTTDEDAFVVATELGGHGVLVATTPRTTAATWRVDTPQRAVELLRGFVEHPEERPGIAAWRRSRHGRYTPIRDYGMVSDSRSAALISPDGSVDWFCAPRFDSPSIFAAVLDNDRGGRFRIRPEDSASYTIEQRYDGETNILVTDFCKHGQCVLRLTDLLVYSRVNALDERMTGHVLLRRLEAFDDVDAKIVFQPRFDYGRAQTSITPNGRGLRAEAGHDYVELVAADVPFQIVEHSDEMPIANGRVSLRADDVRWFRLQTPGFERSPHRHLDEQELLDLTRRTWSRWAGQIQYDGPWREDVVRSALVLKGLVYEPTGALVAAPTTSLPEGLGGVRNWDYRYAWIRDSGYVLETFLRVGHTREAETFIRWLTDLIDKVGGSRSLKPMYRINGDDDLVELSLDHLEGYEGSRPVRIGNGAADQLQLDIYGAAMQLGYLTTLVGKEVPPAQWGMILELVQTVIDLWQEPDAGLWEVRNEPRHHVFSKFQCWLTIDRAIKIGTELGLRGPYPMWRRVAQEIHDSIMTDGWDDEIRSFTQAYGSTALDAALLLMPLRGFLDPTDERIRATVAALRDDLEISDGLLLRYRSADGLTGHEGAFLMCSFWLVEVLADMGEVDEAVRLFERLRSLAGPLGLFAEEVDAVTHEHLGNFPQGFTHMGLVGAACAIHAAQQRQG